VPARLSNQHEDNNELLQENILDRQIQVTESMKVDQMVEAPIESMKTIEAVEAVDK